MGSKISKKDILQAVEALASEVRALKERLDGRDSPDITKQWYSTNEVAELLGRSRFTVQQHWCNKGRIDCEKDPRSGHWRIPASEVQRLQDGVLRREKP